MENVIKSSSGDANKLRLQLISDFHNNKYHFEALMKVVEDNISACQQAGYTNKLKLFIFITSILEGLKKESSDLSLNRISSTNEIESSTAVHTPNFEANVSTTKHLNAKVCTLSTSFNAENILYMDENTKATTNNKKKSIKKAKNERKEVFLKEICAHLVTHKWVVFDHFLPLDLVRRIRIEAGLFKEHYEQSEIWVGKEADVGAHLQVPSVRGGENSIAFSSFFYFIKLIIVYVLKIGFCGCVEDIKKKRKLPREK